MSIMDSNRKSAKASDQEKGSMRKRAKDKARDHGSFNPDYMSNLFLAYKIKLVMWSALGCQFVLLPILVLLGIIMALYYVYNGS